MSKLGLNEIRERFLRFFEEKGHLRLESASLTPQNDNSLLVINSGMAPLKPYFTGLEAPPRKRVVSCQKCIRTGDIEAVGKDGRHGTFFEMLGNFSFGDYFKEEALKWSWEFLTESMGLDPARLYPSVYIEDDEAFAIWRDKIGIDTKRIYKFGKEENFWEHGAGPCGPSSEIYYDRGEEYGCGSPSCAVGCECDRYMEVWNDVFTQFNSDGAGNYTELAQKNIDTGMGLERIALVVQDAYSIFDVDTIKAILDAVCEKAGVSYRANEKRDVSIRIITDHARAITFMAADGILPGNEGRGYVLRRLLRRAARHGRLLGIEGAFLSDLCGVVIEQSKNAYPQLGDKRDYILKMLSVEENRFYETLDEGLGLLRRHIETLKSAAERVLSGGKAFQLYDTFGFPLELMDEILSESGLSVDEAAFRGEMDKQRQRARSARAETTYMGAEAGAYDGLDPSFSTEFCGYNETYIDNAEIFAIINSDGKASEAMAAGESGSVILDKTTFYAEMGGQKGDGGVIKTETGVFAARDCQKVAGGKFAHIGEVIEGQIKAGQKAHVSIDEAKRLDTARNHSATHLLHKALKDVLGPHVEQAGSMVSAERLRFDFTHFQPMTDDEKSTVENQVNDWILANLPVEAKEMSIDEARATGATALFGEKYGKTVRVVTIGGGGSGGGVSMEFCGGTHVKNTGFCGLFKLLGESGVSAGVRRVEALTGRGAIKYHKENEERVNGLSGLLKAEPSLIRKRVEFFIEQAREFKRELDKAKSAGAGSLVDDIAKNAENIGGFKVAFADLTSGGDKDGAELRELGDKLKDKIAGGAAVLSAICGGKGIIMITATDDCVKAGLNCGAAVKAAASSVGANGGGRPNMAQAGIADAALLGKAADAAISAVKAALMK